MSYDDDGYDDHDYNIALCTLIAVKGPRVFHVS